MLVSIKWLEELLHVPLEVETLKKISLNLGLEVEEVLARAPDSIIIGKIQSMKQHPNFKDLTILKIVTKKKIQIVTAAKNVRQGDLVLVVPAGGKLREQTVIERDFKGVRSQGILVSEEELGLADQSTGVIVLEQGSPGSTFKDVFDDVTLDIGTTPNRPDWLSVKGIAREFATHIKTKHQRRQRIDESHTIKQTNRTGAFKIRVQDREGSPRYTARIFDEVTVRESPFWMRWRLHCMGMKAVNNIVDSTNIIMLLNGQPLHPFDLDLVKENIIVRKAHPNERFISLEGSTIVLQKDDLVIADNEGVLALAGIIGSRRAQISGATKRVLLESAYFDPKRIAHTSRRLGLITEASVRFERDVDLAVVDQSSAMAGKLFEKYAQAKEREFVSSGRKSKRRSIPFSLSRLNEILSLQLSQSQIKTLLKKINVKVTGTTKLRAHIPHYRRDLKIEADLHEEVARLYGYMNIPEVMPQRWGGFVTINKAHFNENIVRDFLVGQGFMETYNLSLVSDKQLEELGFATFAKIKNPLNERFNALRPTLFLGLLECVNYNLAKGNRSLKFFEIGNILLPEAAYQEKRIGAILGGERYLNLWNQREELIDYFDAKGLTEGIFDLFHIEEVKFETIEKKGFSQVVKVLSCGRELGYLGCIEENLCKETYYYIELSLDQIVSFASEPFYIPPAKFPANTKDLSFLVDEKIEVPHMVEAIKKVGGPILEKVILFDYYKGTNLPLDKKNLGFRVFFRASDRTLTDKEVDSFIQKIEHEVSEKFDAKLRKKE